MGKRRVEMNAVKWAIVGTLLLVACGGEGPVDIGNDVTGERLEDYVASWDGYAEAFDFGDGSDRVRIELDANGEGSLTWVIPPLRPSPTRTPGTIPGPPCFRASLIESPARRCEVAGSSSATIPSSPRARGALDRGRSPMSSTRAFILPAELGNQVERRRLPLEAPRDRRRDRGRLR